MRQNIAKFIKDLKVTLDKQVTPELGIQLNCYFDTIFIKTEGFYGSGCLLAYVDEKANTWLVMYGKSSWEKTGTPREEVSDDLLKDFKAFKCIEI